MTDRRAFLTSAAVAPMLAAVAPAAGAVGPGVAGARPFPLQRVRLLPGPFEAARALDARYLLSLNADRLLHGFRANAGLAPKAARYGGWESKDLCPGHTLGHYLSACSMMWASTGEGAFHQRVAYVVEELNTCQQAGGSGLVCAFPDGDTQLRNVIAGRPVTGVPWYTMHKILVGLLDAHRHAAHPQALPVLRRLADWMVQATQGIGDERFQQMLGVEFGGMNEAMADVHAFTGDARHLQLAQRFNHRALLDPLAEGRDALDGQHSNTQIPKVIGFQRLAEATGDERCARAARYFWGTVVHKRSFATGGNGEAEHFFPPADARKHLGSAKTMETCCTHNMLRLTRALFTAEPSVAYADYHERALFNGILASQDPDTGMVTYFQALRPAYPKLYGTHERSFWCCTGIGMENFAKLGDSIYFQDARDPASLYVNLFIASTLDWAERGVRLRQTTTFPDEASTRLAIEAGSPVRFRLCLRHPAWCDKLTVTLNGKPLVESTQPGRYVEVDRRWHPGDAIDVALPMRLHLQALHGASDVAAVMHGPLVLAARMGRDGLQPGADLIASEHDYGWVLKTTDTPLPRLALRGRSLDEAVRPAGAPLLFRAAGPGGDIELIPFHRVAHERYSLYWQLT
ncbi:MAG TPA: beta-L-arabinofuranosidase domain-containing protein [Ideonella sp.]|uniref:glycoside hydrolase family 127 protein n=1 Tax=Ideonella sp. TaxID=1929293 RepID=UPI002E304BB0|nr:beta-L-arabinofuranosidase domain-containing protein [Ideonella sp.]HEX5682592.1 beta-L-arabinofuranosidase domain-containing protein [Ideonella sp.]